MPRSFAINLEPYRPHIESLIRAGWRMSRIVTELQGQGCDVSEPTLEHRMRQWGMRIRAPRVGEEDNVEVEQFITHPVGRFADR